LPCATDFINIASTRQPLTSLSEITLIRTGNVLERFVSCLLFVCFVVEREKWLYEMMDSSSDVWSADLRNRDKTPVETTAGPVTVNSRQVWSNSLLLKK
jgi:hypothetical protein